MAFKLSLEKKSYKVCLCSFGEHMEVMLDTDMTKEHKVLASVTGSPLTEADKKVLHKKWTKTVWEKPAKRQAAQRVEKTDWVAIAKDRFVQTITGWEGFIDDKTGKEIEHNEINKEDMYNTQPELVTAIMDVFDSIGELNIKDKEDQKKE